ncbi:MAG: response regulator [Gammaproteobacteria bacterium]|nr:response regulator [Gammaproteobacteria bacterium]
MDKPLLLIVDDEPDMGNFAAFAGNAAGYRSVITISGNEFQQKYLSSSPDLILMDVAMPDIDALGLLEWLSSAGNQCPIILMSGYGDHTLSWARSFADDMGMTIVDSLSKPFMLEELEKVLTDSMTGLL